jgi:hypothetical protein
VAPILGELAFFIGVPQPATVKARPDGDVHLLVLSRDDSDDLLQNYPEQVTVECTMHIQHMELTYADAPIFSTSTSNQIY